MSDVNLTPSLLAMLKRIEQHSPLLMLAVTASGGQDGKLNRLRSAGYVVKCDHPSVTEGAWPAQPLAITEAGRAAPAKQRAEAAEKKGRPRSDDKRVIFRRDGERYIVFLGDDRIGFVRRADNGTWNHSGRHVRKPRHGHCAGRTRPGSSRPLPPRRLYGITAATAELRLGRLAECHCDAWHE